MSGQQYLETRSEFANMSYNEEAGDSELDAIVSLLAELPLQPKKVMAMYYHENM